MSNKHVTSSDAPDKEAAIVASRDEALDVYRAEPKAYDVFYEDAVNGVMTRDLSTTQERVRRKDLGKDPAPAGVP